MVLNLPGHAAPATPNPLNPIPGMLAGLFLTAQLCQGSAVSLHALGLYTSYQREYTAAHLTEINANRRDNYAYNREKILAQQKARRSIPEVRQHRLQRAKLNRLKKSKTSKNM
jgi:hypothetical protein